MLRRSLRRSTIRSIYLRPWKSVLMAILTAGLWPTGLLLWRLWLYASFQRFRAGELAEWAARRHGVLDAPYARMVRRIRPAGTLWLAGVAWLAALASAGVLLQAFVYWNLGWQGALPGDPRRCGPMLGLVLGVSAVSVLQILATLSLRLRMTQFIGRLAIWDLPVAAAGSRFDLPSFVLWPIAGFAMVLPLIVLQLRWAAFWLIASLAAVLAAEVQRGYTTFADRRLRIAAARAIGRIMYGPGPRR